MALCRRSSYTALPRVANTCTGTLTIRQQAVNGNVPACTRGNSTSIQVGALIFQTLANDKHATPQKKARAAPVRKLAAGSARWGAKGCPRRPGFGSPRKIRSDACRHQPGIFQLRGLGSRGGASASRAGRGTRAPGGGWSCGSGCAGNAYALLLAPNGGDAATRRTSQG